MMDAFDLSRQVGELLRARRLTLAIAESCTGGLLGDCLTDVPGSSDYFLGGVLSYSNDAKQRLLGVHPVTLATHGAVSAACAREMAEGVRGLLRADVGVSITGVAGPGGTEQKPQGLTYLHLAAPGQSTGRCETWQGDRRANKEQSALAALRLLLDYLEGSGHD
jgi:nicotinamide-nucleotide amidase